MGDAVTFKCPSCGAYLEFDPDSQKFVCPFCHATFSEVEIQEKSAQAEKDAAASPSPDDAPAADGEARTYHCQSCGAEVVTTATTAATRCYYCHNPIVLSDRVSQDFRPDGVIPFRLDKEAAQAAFNEFIRKMKFVDNPFFSPEQLENFSGVYYPYWFGQLEGEADFEGEGTRINTVSTPREEIVTTQFFHVRRHGRMTFGNLVRKALAANDRKLSDGIHPYQTNGMRPFAMGYLSGFLAEMRDVDGEVVKQEMVEEVQGYAQDIIKESGRTYTTLNGTTRFSLNKATMRYALLPTWVLTYKGDKPGKTFFYMMNGQTGTVCGKLPINKGKLALVAALAGLGVFGLLCLGGALLW